MRRLNARPALVALALLACACGASRPALDAPVYAAPAALGEDGCQPALVAIGAPDEPTPLGFTALDVLGRLAGPTSAPLDWREPAPSEEYLLEYGPERGRSTLALDVRLGEGPVLYRDRVAPLGSAEDVECDPGTLLIPVEVALTSGGQALAEHFDAVLEATQTYRARLSHGFAPDALAGGLSFGGVRSLDPAREFELGPLWLDAVLWPGGSMGSLSVRVDARRARASAALEPLEPAQQPAPIAAWPSGRECPGAARALPSDARVLGFSAADVLDQLARGGPRPIQREQGATPPLTLELAELDAEPCQDVTDRLSFSALLRARSADGSLDAVLPVRVEALDAGGDVGEIQLTSLEADLVPEPGARAVSRP